MKFVLTMQVSPWHKHTDTANQIYRAVNWDVAPERGEMVMLREGDWRAVEHRVFRSNGMLVMELDSAWDRESPLPEGWSYWAPWAKRPDAGHATVDGKWHFYTKGSEMEVAGNVAERLVGPPGELERLQLYRRNCGYRQPDATPTWYVVKNDRIIGYRPVVAGEPAPLEWADACSAGCRYEVIDGHMQFIWADGSCYDAV